MERVRPRTSVSLFVLIVVPAWPACGVLREQQAPQAEVAARYSIHGTVVDATPDCSQERLAELAALESEEDLQRVFGKMLGKRPVPDVDITLRGESITREAVTDAQGKFQLTGLPPGEYEISAEMPAQPSWTGEKRTATAKTRVTLDTHDHYVGLELRADRITVRGRITDVSGRPVAGAKVIGIQEIDDPSCMHYPNIVTTVSDADGSYALPGLDPPNLWRTAGYLNGGDPTAEGHSFYLVVRVEADDFVQGRENVPRFPLVTAELLDSARRLLKAMSQVLTRLEGRSEFQEKEGLGPFPASQGNTIPDIDIVLDPWPRARVSGRVLDTKGKPAQGRVLELSVVNDGSPPLPGDDYAPTRSIAVAVDEHGVFDIPTIVPGRYSVLVYRPSPIGGDRNMEQIPVRGQLLDVKPGARVEGFEIRVNPPEDYAISGHVRDASGKPVCGLFVGTWGDPNGRCWWTRTDRQGAYRIDGLDGTGLSSFKISFGYEGLAILDVPLNSKTADLIVPDKGSIYGVVRNAKTGDVITTCQVTVPVVNLRESGAVWEEPHVEIEWTSDGHFSISSVPAGEATVEIRAEGFGAQRFLTLVEAGKARALECEMLGPPSSQPRLP
jgi:protocatechuate 3,4-dioxygenase beta subunit